MFLAMYSANWVVSPDSPDTAITNLIVHVFDFTLNHFDCPQKGRKCETCLRGWRTCSGRSSSPWSTWSVITKLLSCRIILNGCNNTWRWSDQRLPWRSHQTAFLSDTPSCSLKDPEYNFLKCIGQDTTQFSWSCPQPMFTLTQILSLIHIWRCRRRG